MVNNNVTAIPATPATNPNSGFAPATNNAVSTPSGLIIPWSALGPRIVIDLKRQYAIGKDRVVVNNVIMNIPATGWPG